MTAKNVKGTSTSNLIRKMMDGERGHEFVVSFIQGKVFLSAIDSLVKARKAARLTQTAIAGALGTRQPAIARMEQDTAGSMSLKRLFDYAAACSVTPLITLAPTSRVAEFVYEHPDEPLTADAYLNWKQTRQPVGLWQSLMPNENSINFYNSNTGLHLHQLQRLLSSPQTSRDAAATVTLKRGEAADLGGLNPSTSADLMPARSY